MILRQLNIPRHGRGFCFAAYAAAGRLPGVGLRDSPHRGAVFENPTVTAPGKPELIEITSAQTHKPQFVRNLHTVGDALGQLR